MKLPRILVAAATAALTFLAAASMALAASVTADVTAQVHGRYIGSNDLGTPTFRVDIEGLTQLAPGTGAGKADLLFSDERTLAASANESLDLAGGLTDPLGASLTFARVKAILIIAATGNTNDVCVGGATSNAFLGPFADATDVACVRPGGVLLVSDRVGYSVTAGTGDLLKVANSASGTGVTYKILILGASA